MKSSNEEGRQSTRTSRTLINRYRKVEVRTWNDEKFVLLSDMQPSGKALWIYLLSGPHTNLIPGVLNVSHLAMAGSLHWSQDAFDACFDEIRRKKMARADWDAQLVWLPKAIEHNVPNSPNVVKHWRSQWDMIPNCALKRAIYDRLKQFVEALGTGYQQAFAASIAEPQVPAKSSKASRMDSQIHSERKRKSITKGIAEASRMDSQNHVERNCKSMSNTVSSSSSSKPKPKVKNVTPDLRRSRPNGEKRVLKANYDETLQSLEILKAKPGKDLPGDGMGAGDGKSIRNGIANPSRMDSQNHVERVTVKATPDKDKAQPVTAETWRAYGEAYTARYGTSPVRNATVNAQMARFVERVGCGEAPEVARFFVGSNTFFYVNRGHAIGDLLHDAEKLRTEWATQRRTTATGSAMIDRTQTNADAFAPLLAEARAHEAAAIKRDH